MPNIATSGTDVPVGDGRLEPVEFYVCLDLETYRWRGHRRLAAIRHMMSLAI